MSNGLRYYARCIDILLSEGVDINDTFDDDMYSHLMYAAARNRKGCLLHLLRRNADIKFTNKAGETALCRAIETLDDGESSDYTNIELCFVAGGDPPTRRYIDVHLPHVADRRPVPESLPERKEEAMCLCFEVKLCKLIDISNHSKCDNLDFKIYAWDLNPGPLAPKARIIPQHHHCWLTSQKFSIHSHES